MKTIKITLSIVLLCMFHFSFALDRVVQENGPAGTFSTISTAIAASADGDRIIVHPKIGDNPYVEDLVINKSLEIVSATDGVRYKLQGNIEITALNNRLVTIIGAQLVLGNIAGNTTGWRTNVNIMGCKLDGGNIDFNNQFYVTVVSNILENGSINLSHGRIIGNQLNNERSLINIRNSNSITNDTMNIIGNIIPRIWSQSSSDIFLNIQNNFIRRVLINNTEDAHSIRYSFSSSSIKLNIINNTILTPRSNVFIGRARYLSLSARAAIKNNIIDATALMGDNAPDVFMTGINSSSFNFVSQVNLVDYPALSDTDTEFSGAIVDQTTGRLLLPTAASNGADPSFEYYDLDLTRGDAGCYGGSYSLDNFFPITGSSRVFWIDAPFGAVSGSGQIQVKAEGFDR